MMNCKIIESTYIGGYCILFKFKDGVTRLADFGPFMESSSHNLIRKFLDVELFSKFKIKHWGMTVSWGNNEFDISAIDIYNGEFDRKSLCV